MAHVFPDIFEQTVVTEFIRREYESIARQAGGGEDRTTEYGARILPLRSVNGRHVKIRYQDIIPKGLAQFKAPGATPALWTFQPNLREKLIELVDIDEFHRIDPIDMLKLKSPDPNVLREAMTGLADRGAALMGRNDLRTEWMRWEALKGNLTVTYPDSSSVTINYGIPMGHFPTFTTPWSDLADADPIEDLWSLSACALSDAGVYLSLFHMNSATFRYLRRSTKVKEALSTYGHNVMLPTDNDLRDLLRENSQIQIVDSGYLTENQTNKVLNKWIPDGKIFATTSDYTYAGRPVGNVADGWVLVAGSTTAQEPIARQGTQSEFIYNRVGQQSLLRVASARMPRIDAPEVLAWAEALD